MVQVTMFKRKNRKLEIMRLRHERDLLLLQQAVLNVGYYYTLEEIEGAWDRYSDSMAAGWMGFPAPGDAYSDSETYRKLKEFMDSDEEYEWH